MDGSSGSSLWWFLRHAWFDVAHVHSHSPLRVAIRRHRAVFLAIPDVASQLLAKWVDLLHVFLDQGHHSPVGTRQKRGFMECTHTDLLHAHFPAALTLRVHFAHSSVCYTHAWLKGVCSAHVVISLSSHFFSSFTRPCCSLTVTSRPLPTTRWSNALTFTSTTSCRTFPT